MHGLSANELRFSFIDDAELIFKPDAGRLFPHNIVCQSMQGADAVFIKRFDRVFEEAFDAGLKVVHRRVDQGHDQNFLVVLQLPAADDLRRECRQDVGFACAGDCGDPKPSAGVLQDVLLGWAWNEISHDV